MQRYILDDKTKTFYTSDLHHIKHVMRFKNGEEVVVCLNKTCYLARLAFDQALMYEIINVIDDIKTPAITLIQGALKGSKIETTIKYATIFGASSIYVVPFERSIAKNKNIEYKQERLFNIAKEAVELSHRKSIPNILFYESLNKISFSDFDYVVLADENETKNTINDLKLDLDKNICILIGPEGGIAESERELLKKHDVIKISLGKYIFPAEIAAINILSKLI